VVVSVLLSALTLLVGKLAYDIVLPHHWLAVAVTVASGVASFSALGIAGTAFVSNADAAPAVVNGVFFPIVFISGTFFPISSGSVLVKIANFFPVRHLIVAMFATFDPRRRSVGPDWSHLAVLLAWGVAGLVVALRRFRWEPRPG
jgi:ABC-2 type transport system permease protein